jgi:hypothetical protein
MKFVKLLMAVCAVVLTTAAFGQDVLPIPATPEQMHQITVRPASTQSEAVPLITGSTIPTWSYSTVSPIDGKTYAGQIIGVNPATKPGMTTVIPTVLIPVQLVFKYSSTVSYVFDPTVTDTGCLAAGNTGFRLTEDSPLFNDASFVLGGTNVGTTQYVDAFQRANFWNDVSASGGANYHTLLGVAPMPLQTVTVTAANTGSANGTVYSFSGLCGSNTGNVNAPGLLGVMSLSFWDPIARSMITKLGITPNTFVFFLFYNAAVSNGAPDVSANCCILGYHGLSGAQTYGAGDFEGRDQTLFSGTADTSALSHEFAGWMNDPTSKNLTPAWGLIGVSGCQDDYEVGGPLSATLMPAVKMPNGFTYHLQELAFFDWFYRISPSKGLKGWYSDHDTLKSDAGSVCP